MEQVVLLDETGRVVGAADKAAIHHRRTPLHLAFSCYVINDREEVLLTRRAESKRTWPGVWTNTCCGHPMPGEDITAAVHRRAAHELGVTLARVDLILPDFRYRATMANGLVENEICPVFRAVPHGDAGPAPNPSEVADVRWLPWRAFAEGVLAGALDVSPWCREQVARLPAGRSPLEWPPVAPSVLPSGARP